MAYPEVMCGVDGLQIWRMTGNVNGQSQTAEEEWSSSLGVLCRALTIIQLCAKH